MSFMNIYNIIIHSFIIYNIIHYEIEVFFYFFTA